MAKSKKERRSSIRHMAAEDTFGVLEALERLEQAERVPTPAEDDGDEGDGDDPPSETLEP